MSVNSLSPLILTLFLLDIGRAVTEWACYEREHRRLLIFALKPLFVVLFLLESSLRIAAFQYHPGLNHSASCVWHTS